MKPQEITRAAIAPAVSLGAGAVVRIDAYGRRAAKLARLTALGLAVPPGAALSFDCVRALAEGGPVPALPIEPLEGRLLALRASPESRAWGGPAAIVGLGMSPASLPLVERALGAIGARDLYRRFIPTYALAVHGLEPEDFEAVTRRHLGEAGAAMPTALGADALDGLIDAMRAVFAERAEVAFPDDPQAQLAGAARAMAQAWNAASARILRQAKGAPDDGGLGLIVQEFVPGEGPGICGEGSIRFVDPRTGAPACSGSFVPRGAAAAGSVSEEAGPRTLDALCPEAFAELEDSAQRAALGLGEAFVFDFTLRGGRIAILDAVPVRRTARASVRIAVDLVHAGAITREDALLRIEPRNLVEHLHPQIDPGAERDAFCSGLGASPGAATGRIVFTAEAAQAAAAQDEASILVRVETSPEDIRGMHSARGVLTIRGGMTSHAAVIARGLGLPCVVGAGDLRLDPGARTLIAPDSRVFGEGTVITLDGSSGEVMLGAPEMIAPELDGAFADLLDWADAVRDIGVRANADTPAEARTARSFNVDGLGLCRTEHMFYDASRITVMREMILADNEDERRVALDRLLPMQRADFEEMFEIMRGLPVTIRLLDPPLHEFLPHSPEETQALAAAMGKPVEGLAARIADMAEVNPMLGKRGVRLGITMPEIYGMQARAIFEAAVAVNRRPGAAVVPEVMIPLVSANREAEIVKAQVDAIAAEVRREQKASLDYHVGVMVETPRAALRSGDLAASSAFLSFGTNDLTQMTYGLSRDDAGRFMRGYVNQGVYAEDPFHSLDVEGVGELILIAARRGRARNPDLVLGLCGEHGGDPSSVRFCKLAGFDYVSCSPFRVPIARLAAAQATLLVRAGSGSDSGRAGEEDPGR